MPLPETIATVVRLRRAEVVRAVAAALHSSTCGCRGFLGDHAQEYRDLANAAVDALTAAPEREEELRREGARRVGVQLECAYEQHAHSQLRGAHRAGKTEGLKEAIDIARRTSARPASEETPSHD